MIGIPLALAAYAITWAIDRRQRPALLAGSAGGILGVLLSFSLAI